MGWRIGKFPVISQLNVMTNPAHIEDTKKAFKEKFGDDGATYELGSLCMEWDKGDVDAEIPDPPWANDADNPWNREDASDWRAHCLVDLGNENQGSVDNGPASGKSVKEDLEDWIKDAILNGKHIKYKYKKKEISTEWRADKKIISANRIRIIVRGPGF